MRGGLGIGYHVGLGIVWGYGSGARRTVMWMREEGMVGIDGIGLMR